MKSITKLNDELRKHCAEVDPDDYDAQSQVDRQLAKFAGRVVNLDGLLETLLVAVVSIFPIYLWSISRPRHWFFMAAFVACWLYVVAKVIVMIDKNRKKT